METVSIPKGLRNISELIGKSFASKDNTVKLDIGEPINHTLFHGTQAFPHVTNELDGKLFSVRFHHGTIQDDDAISIKQTYAIIDVGKNLVRVRGIVFFHYEGVAECLAFVILVSQQEAKRVLVNEQTWFAKPDSIETEKWAPLLEGRND